MEEDIKERLRSFRSNPNLERWMKSDTKTVNTQQNSVNGNFNEVREDGIYIYKKGEYIRNDK